MVTHSYWQSVERECRDCGFKWYEPSESSLGLPCPGCGSSAVEDVYTNSIDTDCPVVHEEDYGL